MKKVGYSLACVILTAAQLSAQMTQTPSKTTEGSKKPLLIFNRPASLSFYADLGADNLSYTSGNETDKYSGLAWGLGASLSVDAKKSSPVVHNFWSAGIGFRNLNSSNSFTDPNTGESITDKYSMWYLEIPVSFTSINSKSMVANKGKIAYYWQAGLSLGFKLKVSENDGTETTDETAHSSGLNISPFISGGIAFKGAGHTFLLGPYLSYSINNLSSESGVTAHAFSYGIKLMACPFK